MDRKPLRNHPISTNDPTYFTTQPQEVVGYFTPIFNADDNPLEMRVIMGTLLTDRRMDYWPSTRYLFTRDTGRSQPKYWSGLAFVI